jgi:hypothetical protein
MKIQELFENEPTGNLPSISIFVGFTERLDLSSIGRFEKYIDAVMKKLNVLAKDYDLDYGEVYENVRMTIRNLSRETFHHPLLISDIEEAVLKVTNIDAFEHEVDCQWKPAYKLECHEDSMVQILISDPIESLAGIESLVSEGWRLEIFINTFRVQPFGILSLCKVKGFDKIELYNIDPKMKETTEVINDILRQKLSVLGTQQKLMAAKLLDYAKL